MKTRIRIRHSDGSLFDGNSDQDLAGYDLNASADLFGDLLATEIAREYPDADLDIERSDGEDSVRVIEDDGPNYVEVEAVEGISSDLFNTMDWYVKEGL
jgi:hypothetical protein